MADLKFYRSRVHSLKVVVAQPDTDAGEVAPETVDFVPYEEKYQGDAVKIGYLKTDNPVAIKALSDDVNVEEIKADEYNKATDPKTAVKASV